MKNLRIPFASAILALMAGIGASPATADGTAAVRVNVTFDRVITVISGEPIQFGNVKINTNAGTVVIDKDTSEVTSSGGVVDADEATSQRGSFSFIAPRPGNVGVTIDASIDLLLNPPDPEVPAGQVTFTPSVEVNRVDVQSHDDLYEVHIGGALNFGTLTREGHYEGTVTVSVGYT